MRKISDYKISKYVFTCEGNQQQNQHFEKSVPNIEIIIRYKVLFLEKQINELEK